MKEPADLHVEAAGLDRFVHRFDPDTYNPALPIAENLLFATPKQVITPELIEGKIDFLRLLHDLSLASNLETLARNILEMLRQGQANLFNRKANGIRC